MLAPRSLGAGGGEIGGVGGRGGGITERSLCLGDLYHQLGKGYASILKEEEERSGGFGWGCGGWLLGTTYFKSRAAPYHPLFFCPPTPPLAPGSTQKCGCLCHCNLALFAKRFHCLLCAIGACMNRSQQDAGWHHSGSGVGVEKLHVPFSRGPLSSFILARLNPGLSNAWANSGG